MNLNQLLPSSLGRPTPTLPNYNGPRRLVGQEAIDKFKNQYHLSGQGQAYINLDANGNPSAENVDYTGQPFNGNVGGGGAGYSGLMGVPDKWKVGAQQVANSFAQTVGFQPIARTYTQPAVASVLPAPAQTTPPQQQTAPTTPWGLQRQADVKPWQRLPSYRR